MDLDLLAESDTDNESVHGGSVHSVGPYENTGSQGTASRNNNNQQTNNDGNTLLTSYHRVVIYLLSLCSWVPSNKAQISYLNLGLVVSLILVMSAINLMIDAPQNHKKMYVYNEYLVHV